MRQKSFNIVHAAVALLCVMVIVTIMVVLNSARTRDRTRMPNSTQLRGIHQGMVTFANSNKEFFPGLAPDGSEDTQVLDWREEGIPLMQAGLSIDQRFAILLHGDYFTPEYAISPGENDPNIKPWPGEGTITTGHYSYAMLQIPAEGGRRDEWKQTLNSQAIVMSDRNTGTLTSPSSIHVDSGDAWAGSVLWNDSHVGFESTDEFETKYNGGDLNEADRLFPSTDTYNALMIHSGN
ncbi:MAG: hypothetical protein AB8C95_03955 [Phycisphaeraceae bacterium]